MLEERLDDELAADRRCVWGVRGIDDLILREREEEVGSSSSSSSAGATGRHYALGDSMSVTAIFDDTGTVRERYGYTGFGAPRYIPDPSSILAVSNYYKHAECLTRYYDAHGFH